MGPGSFLDGQRLAGGDPELLMHQVDSRHHLGDRVLDLQPGVHLEEVEVALGVDQELDRAGPFVVGGFGHGDRGLAERLALPAREDTGGRLLDELLVAALNRAVAFAQEDTLAVRVEEDLRFDVAGAVQVFLDVDLGGPEVGVGLALSRLIGSVEVARFPGHLEPPSSATVGRLDGHRVAVFVGQAAGLALGLERLEGSGHPGHTGLFSGPSRTDLVSHDGNRVRGRAHPHESLIDDPLGEVGVLGEEAVAGMDGGGAGLPSHFQQAIDVEVGLGRRRRPDVPRLVGQLDVQRLTVDFRVDGNGAHPQLASPANDPERDLAPVGDEDGVDLPHSGMLPCLRGGSVVRLWRSISRARIRRGRVSRGSMTSSTRPRSAAM